MTVAEILAYPDGCPVSDLALSVTRAGAPAPVQSKNPQGGSFLRQDLTGADSTGSVDVSLILEGIPAVSVGAALTINAGKMHTYQGRRSVRCSAKNGGVTVAQNTLAPPPAGATQGPGAYRAPAQLTTKTAAELVVTIMEDVAGHMGLTSDMAKLAVEAPPEVFRTLGAIANTILMGVERGNVARDEE